MEVAEQTYYRWRKQYGGMQVEQAKQLKELQKENARLKKLVAGKTGRKGLLYNTFFSQFNNLPIGKSHVI